jgi:peptidoglycan/xylan/chitin deacetylase (PgdA/CDA1 family)
MYNHVYSADDRPSNLTGNWILDTDLEEQVKFLSENGYYYPGWKELRAWIDGEISLPAKSIVVTFDGGKKDFLKHGAPLFEEYRIPVTVFMACWEKNAGAEKVVKYASSYIDFESHSYAMAQGGQSRGYRGIVADMSKDEIKEDLEKAHKIIGNNDAFSYPYGDVTNDCIEALQEQGILCAFITDYGRVRQGMDPYRLPRVRVLGDQSFESWRQSVR